MLQIQSTFMTDLQQISFALNQVTNRSLLIVDEFGKGTNSTGTLTFTTLICNVLTWLNLRSDGAGLACGLLDCLLSMGDERPKVLAATHFHEIFENGFLPPRPELAFGHMEVRVDAKAQQLEDQVTYLYKLRRPNLPGSLNSYRVMLTSVLYPAFDRDAATRVSERSRSPRWLSVPIYGIN
jgi:DNA mismatch repair protein MSH5